MRDGIIFTTKSVIPLKENQKRIFEKTLIEEPGDMEHYLASLLYLTYSQRESVLQALRECVEHGSVEKLGPLLEDGDTRDVFQFIEDEALQSLIKEKKEEARRKAEEQEDNSTDNHQESD